MKNLLEIRSQGLGLFSKKSFSDPTADKLTICNHTLHYTFTLPQLVGIILLPERKTARILREF